MRRSLLVAPLALTGCAASLESGGHDRTTSIIACAGSPHPGHTVVRESREAMFPPGPPGSEQARANAAE